MPLYLTGSHSSRISKPTRGPRGVCRQSSSPFAALPRTKSITRTKSLAEAWEDEADHEHERLPVNGKIQSTISVASVRDVMSAVLHATTNMFGEIPDRAGMNSTRIAEVLNYQKGLPAVVSLAHVHALISASSKTEREISALLSAGKVRKIRVTGRGNDISGTGEVLITTRQIQDLLANSGVTTDITSDFIHVLQQNPRATSLSSRSLPASHVKALTRAGFLVSSSLSGPRNLSLSGASHVAIPTISRANSGTLAAVGGEAAFEELGGVGGPRRSYSEPQQSSQGGEYSLSVPNIGPYLKLLTAGRNHLLELLGRSKFKESPLYLLRERWDGAVDSDDRVSSAKRIRGEFSGILPAKTKKWKDLQGLKFDWVLEECLGAGLIELFETHSVGLGIRALT